MVQTNGETEKKLMGFKIICVTKHKTSMKEKKGKPAVVAIFRVQTSERIEKNQQDRHNKAIEESVLDC